MTGIEREYDELNCVVLGHVHEARDGTGAQIGILETPKQPEVLFVRFISLPRLQIPGKADTLIAEQVLQYCRNSRVKHVIFDLRRLFTEYQLGRDSGVDMQLFRSASLVFSICKKFHCGWPQSYLIHANTTIQKSVEQWFHRDSGLDLAAPVFSIRTAIKVIEQNSHCTTLELHSGFPAQIRYHRYATYPRVPGLLCVSYSHEVLNENFFVTLDQLLIRFPGTRALLVDANLEFDLEFHKQLKHWETDHGVGLCFEKFGHLGKGFRDRIRYRVNTDELKASATIAMSRLFSPYDTLQLTLGAGSEAITAVLEDMENVDALIRSLTYRSEHDITGARFLIKDHTVMNDHTGETVHTLPTEYSKTLRVPLRFATERSHLRLERPDDEGDACRPISRALYRDLVQVLQFFEKMLKTLPNEKIERFKASEAFNSYVFVLNALGIINERWARKLPEGDPLWVSPTLAGALQQMVAALPYYIDSLDNDSRQTFEFSEIAALWRTITKDVTSWK